MKGTEMGQGTPLSNRVNYRVSDFLDEFGIGRTKFYALVKVGDIRIVKCGRRTLIPMSAAIEFQARLESGALAAPEVL
tara:strand:+ start:78 stop:311 length:234 start_codon:yes stop_codon:yes gene_type:complete